MRLPGSARLLLPLPLRHPPPQDYKARGMQLILSNPSPRVVHLMERSGLINKIGRDWIFVRVHDAIVNCQRSLLQMEAGGTLPGSVSKMWAPAFGSSGGGASDGEGGRGHGHVHGAAVALAESAGGSQPGCEAPLVPMSAVHGVPSGRLREKGVAELDRQPSL